nr:MAG TPA: hypothetical protein [Caudoviricetes sp.]
MLCSYRIEVNHIFCINKECSVFSQLQQFLKESEISQIFNFDCDCSWIFFDCICFKPLTNLIKDLTNQFTRISAFFSVWIRLKC